MFEAFVLLVVIATVFSVISIALVMVIAGTAVHAWLSNQPVVDAIRPILEEF